MHDYFLRRIRLRRLVLDIKVHRQNLLEEASEQCVLFLREHAQIPNRPVLSSTVLATKLRGRENTYGDLAKANDVPWSAARHAMNGAGGHLDRLLDICHARGLPLFTAICVNQEGLTAAPARHLKPIYKS